MNGKVINQTRVPVDGHSRVEPLLVVVEVADGARAVVDLLDRHIVGAVVEDMVT
jgi:hypothetical protein